MLSRKLPNQDSNLDWLIQSQKCCHYTIGHLNRLQNYTFFISYKKKNKKISCASIRRNFSNPR